MGEHDDLLRRHQPGVKYDSMEQYFADSAEQWLVNPGNELRRADTGNARGEVLATGAQLTLAFLAASSSRTVTRASLSLPRFCTTSAKLGCPIKCC